MSLRQTTINARVGSIDKFNGVLNQLYGTPVRQHLYRHHIESRVSGIEIFSFRYIREFREIFFCFPNSQASCGSPDSYDFLLLTSTKTIASPSLATISISAKGIRNYAQRSGILYSSNKQRKYPLPSCQSAPYQKLSLSHPMSQNVFKTPFRHLLG